MKLNKEQELKLIVLAQAGSREALNVLIKYHNRFILRVARQLGKLNKKVEVSDLVQVGRIGLLCGIEKFDVTRGVKLLSYAVSHIQQKIRVILKTADVVKLPFNYYSDMSKAGDEVERVKFVRAEDFNVGNYLDRGCANVEFDIISILRKNGLDIYDINMVLFRVAYLESLDRSQSLGCMDGVILKGKLNGKFISRQGLQQHRIRVAKKLNKDFLSLSYSPGIEKANMTIRNNQKRRNIKCEPEKLKAAQMLSACLKAEMI